MRAVIQAVSSASVRVNGGEPRPIGPGLVILLGVKDTDTLDIVPKLAEKCAGLRIFKDENDKMSSTASSARICWCRWSTKAPAPSSSTPTSGIKEKNKP